METSDDQSHSCARCIPDAGWHRQRVRGNSKRRGRVRRRAAQDDEPRRGPEFALTDRALSQIQGSAWEGRRVVVVYQERDGQKLASDVELTGTNLQQQRQRNRLASAGSPGISGINPATNAQSASGGSGSGISGVNAATKG
jgi:hypothetical protein